MKLAPLSLLLLAFMGAATQPKVRAVLQPASNRQPAPDFALPDSSGQTIHLNNYRGEIVLLDFWATWCHGCKEEIPWFAEFERKYSPKGLAVVGVSLDDDGWKVLRPFLKTNPIPYRILLGAPATANSYGIRSMPDTYLIDRQGRIAATYLGLVDKDNVEANIVALLQTAP